MIHRLAYAQGGACVDSASGTVFSGEHGCGTVTLPLLGAAGGGNASVTLRLRADWFGPGGGVLGGSDAERAAAAVLVRFARAWKARRRDARERAMLAPPPPAAAPPPPVTVPPPASPHSHLPPLLRFHSPHPPPPPPPPPPLPPIDALEVSVTLQRVRGLPLKSRYSLQLSLSPTAPGHESPSFHWMAGSATSRESGAPSLEPRFGTSVTLRLPPFDAPTTAEAPADGGAARHALSLRHHSNHLVALWDAKPVLTVSLIRKGVPLATGLLALPLPGGGRERGSCARAWVALVSQRGALEALALRAAHRNHGRAVAGDAREGPESEAPPPAVLDPAALVYVCVAAAAFS